MAALYCNRWNDATNNGVHSTICENEHHSFVPKADIMVPICRKKQHLLTISYSQYFYLIVIFHTINPYGLYGNISKGETYLIAIIFFAFQSFLSWIWLKEYQQGPIEYFWKKMSYATQK